MENSSSSASIESTSQNESDSSGCGCSNITISVNPTTGGQFDLAVTKNDTIENLKKLISKKLKVPKERICLLHRERQLRDGTVQENQLVNGSRLTLLPSVETGLLVIDWELHQAKTAMSPVAQRPEQSVMQALESLNDCQVNDFLSGKAPLNLTMRLGDHMMLIQLQLSTVTPNSSSQSSSSTSSSSSSTNVSSPSSDAKRVLTSPNKSTTQSTNKPVFYPPTSPNQPHKDPLASLSSIVESTAPSPTSTSLNSTLVSPATATSSNSNSSIINHNTATASPTTNNITPNNSMTNSSSINPMSTATSCSPSSFSTPVTLSSNLSPTPSTPSIPPTSSSSSTPTNSSSASSLIEGCKCDSSTSKPMLDTRALAEASRNLTQTLKQLSSEVLTSKADPVEDVTTSSKRRQGAIIESMHHHGKGVYSGTFSGTLNPALQDRFGRPKRDISTIIHILNDLLCATPQYRNCRGSSSSNNTNTSSMNSDKATSCNQQPLSTIPDAEGSSNTFLSASESLENQATRGKMERLRLIMEEKREKRRAARSSPYARNPGGQPVGQHLNSIGGLKHTQWSAISETQRTNTSSAATDQPNLPMDTDICSQPEVSPEPVVA